MEFFWNFPFISIILSLLCAVITFLLKGGTAKRLTLGLNLSCIIMSLLTVIRNLTLGEFTYTMGHYTAPWGNEIRAGLIEPLFAMIFSVILMLSIMAIREEKYIEDSKLNLFFVMSDLIQAAILALAYTNDIFTAYVFIEICTIASCGLLMIRDTGKTIIAATRYMIFSLLGSGFFLIGVILLYDITGHLLMPNIKDAVTVLWETGNYRLPLYITVGLMVTGLGIKSGMFPFFFWMPDTYGYASPDASSILSGVVSKIYILLLIKVIYSVIGAEVFFAMGIQYLLLVFGICGMMTGSILAIREKQLDRMIAYSSAAQIGYIYMGIGMGELGIAPAMLHITAHAVAKPLLFVSASRLSAVSGESKRFADLAGSGYRCPVSGACFTIGALSMVGIPGLVGFSSKLYFAEAALEAPMSILAPVLLALAVSTLLNAAYYLRAVICLYSKGSRKIHPDETDKERPMFLISIIAFSAVIFILGIFPGYLMDIIGSGLEIL
ncbi:MAG: sodium:proton antiporter [Ruminococcaceae bacterium]|nr:sodium:proton antiporter [Oscillospiraceae bacterium]